MSGRSARLVLAAICVFAAVVGASAPGSGEMGEGSERPSVDNTVTRIAVASNGTARWTVQIRTRLENRSEVTSYEAFQRRFRNDTARRVERFSERMRTIAARAENATGRRMAVRDFSASTTVQEVPRRWGVVTYRFYWDGFAATTDEALVVGDVFQGGYYLAEHDTLRIAAPPDRVVGSVEPTATTSGRESVSWVGPRSFGDERPRVRFENETGTTGEDSVESPDETTATARSSPADEQNWVLGALVAGGVLLVGIVGLVGRNRYAAGDRSAGGENASTADGGPTPGGRADSTRRDGSEDRVLTDAERIRRLLEANDGRLRQREIADEFGWSASKTSRTLSSMVDEGTVEKLQLGRENVIDLNADE